MRSFCWRNRRDVDPLRDLGELYADQCLFAEGAIEFGDRRVGVGEAEVASGMPAGGEGELVGRVRQAAQIWWS